MMNNDLEVGASRDARNLVNHDRYYRCQRHCDVDISEVDDIFCEETLCAGEKYTRDGSVCGLKDELEDEEGYDLINFFDLGTADREGNLVTSYFAS